MRSPLRALLAQPWLRFRFPLLSFLLGSALAAVIVAHWLATREANRLRLQVAALQAENKGHRDRLGILTITDAALPYAIDHPSALPSAAPRPYRIAEWRSNGTHVQ